MIDARILEDIGLSKSEIAVYLTLLELGQSTSGPIIDKSSLQSSVVHRVIKSLMEKALISYVVIGKDKHYKATHPKSLLNYISDKERKLKDILPELLHQQAKSSESNQVEMFIGKRAIFSLLNDTISDGKRGEEYYSFSLVEPHDDEEMVDFYSSFNLKRREKGLKVFVLAHKTVKQIYEKHYSLELLKKASVRYTDFHFPQGLIIFRDFLILVNWQERPSAIKITNKLTAEQFKQFFLESYNKEKNAY